MDFIRSRITCIREDSVTSDTKGEDEWNRRYQSAMSLPESNLGEKCKKYTILNGLNRDFIAVAHISAKTIISEYFLDDNDKSIRPATDIGGLAGGKKYVWRGILFKLADGQRSPYYDDFEAAAKTMGHELKAANSYFRCAIPGLHVALQALIDYKGFRMHAQAILPINQNTIRVGSSDAGLTCYADFDYMDRMKWAARELNICEHVVNGKKMYSACDVEGHAGEDDRFYLIDLARTFPPEAKVIAAHLFAKTGKTIQRQSDANTVFWRLLRPEFVKRRGGELVQQQLHEVHFDRFRRRSDSVASQDKVMATTSAWASSTTTNGYTPPVMCRENSRRMTYLEVLRSANAITCQQQSETPGTSTIRTDHSDQILVPTEQSSPLPPLVSTYSLLPASSVSQESLDTIAPNFRHPSCLPTPLSSDAFTNFGASDPNCHLRNNEVLEATKVLIHLLIPKLAERLVTNGWSECGGLPLKDFMHKYGVNMRHAGLLLSHVRRHHLTQKEIWRLTDTDIAAASGYYWLVVVEDEVVEIENKLLEECVLRTLKNILRDCLRSHTMSRSGSEHQLCGLVVRFLNLVTGAHTDSSEFWSTTVTTGVIRRFGECTLETVLVEATKVSATNADIALGGPNLWDICVERQLLRPLITRLSAAAGIVMSTSCLEYLNNHVKHFEFVQSDISEFCPVVKHMHQVDLREGTLLLLTAQLREADDKPDNLEVIDRLMILAIDRLKKALAAVPDDLQTKHALADAYQLRGHVQQRSLKTSESQQSFELFRSLDSLSHTRCCKTGVSYREDLLGILISVTHFTGKKARLKAAFAANEESPDWPVLRVKAAEECTPKVEAVAAQTSLRYFLDHCAGVAVKSSDGTLIKRRFIPLVIDEEHGSRALALLKEELVRIDRCSNEKYEFSLHSAHVSVRRVEDLCIIPLLSSPNMTPLPAFSCSIGFRVLSAIMNSVVVSFFGSGGDALLQQQISTNNLADYMRFHHMLLFLASEDDMWRTESNKQVERFVYSPEHRGKEYVEDLGRFLIHLVLSDRTWDDSFQEAFLTELLARQVHWYFRGEEAAGVPSHPELLNLESDDVCPYRLVTTFQATLKSLRLTMFQVYFLLAIARRDFTESGSMLSLYNNSLGRPTVAMRGSLFAEFEAILKVDSYEGFLSRMGCCFSPKQFTSMLRNAVRDSILRGYMHVPRWLSGKSKKEWYLHRETVSTVAAVFSSSDAALDSWATVATEYDRKLATGEYKGLPRLRSSTCSSSGSLTDVGRARPCRGKSRAGRRSPCTKGDQRSYYGPSEGVRGGRGSPAGQMGRTQFPSNHHQQQHQQHKQQQRQQQHQQRHQHQQRQQQQQQQQKQQQQKHDKSQDNGSIRSCNSKADSGSHSSVAKSGERARCDLPVEVAGPGAPQQSDSRKNPSSRAGSSNGEMESPFVKAERCPTQQSDRQSQYTQQNEVESPVGKYCAEQISTAVQAAATKQSACASICPISVTLKATNAISKSYDEFLLSLLESNK